MPNHYRELECPDYHEINQEIITWLQNEDHIMKSTRFWNNLDLGAMLYACPGFLQWLKAQDLMLRALAVTVGRHHNCCGPHIDTPPARFKLSWPVKNSAHSWNCWYTCTIDDPEIIINDLGGISYLDATQLQEVQRRPVTAPALIDVAAIHDVVIKDAAQWPRIVLQGQLLKEPLSLSEYHLRSP